MLVSVFVLRSVLYCTVSSVLHCTYSVYVYVHALLCLGKVDWDAESSHRHIISCHTHFFSYHTHFFSFHVVSFHTRFISFLIFSFHYFLYRIIYCNRAWFHLILLVFVLSLISSLILIILSSFLCILSHLINFIRMRGVE